MGAANPLFVSLGCAAENLVQAALAHGLAGEVRFDAASDAVRATLAPTPARATPLFKAIPERQCTRGDYDGKPLSNEELRLLESAATADGVRVLLLTERSMMEQVLDHVVRGNTAQLAGPAFVKELKAWIGFNGNDAARTRDGLYSVSSGSPSIPTWIGDLAFGLFFTPSSENDKYARQIRSAAGIAVFIGQAADKAHWVNIGRCFERFALQATALGIRNAFARFDARYHVSELEGLPAPVQRYFRAVLTDGQPIIAAASIEMVGTINMSASAEQWKPFTSHQRVVTSVAGSRPGFLWDAQVAMFPGVPARVVDSYVAGQGQLIAKLLGLFTVADAHGGGELACGEFMRCFAEAAWYPTALLPSQGVRWQAAGEASAKATLVDGPITVTLLFSFNEAVLLASVRAESRGAGVGKDMVMLPWDCALSDYQPQDGMLLPMTGEAAWMRPDGRKAYFVGHVKKLSYEFLP